MPVGPESDPIIWKFVSSAFGILVAALTYFIKRRDEKIEENTKEVQHLREEVLVMKTHMELFTQEQGEMKESLTGVSECVQEIRIHLASLPCRDRRCALRD